MGVGGIVHQTQAGKKCLTIDKYYDIIITEREVIKMSLTICIRMGTIDLIDSMTGEVYATGTKNINMVLNVLDSAEVHYTIRTEIG